MAGEVVFESQEPWDATRPQTTIITCVDGRSIEDTSMRVRVNDKVPA